jgi:AsmA protein
LGRAEPISSGPCEIQAEITPLKALKIVLYLVLGLVVLVAAAAAIFAMTFDPNRYKGDIQRIVKEKTGRTLELKGPLELAFWPSLGAKVSGVVLSTGSA